MCNIRRWIGTAVLALPLAACYEWVPDYQSPACRARAATAPSRGGAALTFVPLVDGETSMALPPPLGRVRALGIGVPSTRVRFTAAGVSREVTTDSAGSFTLGGLPPGRYRLLASRVGFRSTWDSVTVPWDTATTLEVTLQPVSVDGPCSGFSEVRVRRPWWKVWKLL